MSAQANLALLTVEDLAVWFRVRKRKVYDLVRNDGLPFLRMGRFLRFRRADVDLWLSARTASVPVPGASRDGS
jgi:excisionase family DNA binding protein